MPDRQSAGSAGPGESPGRPAAPAINSGRVVTITVRCLIPDDEYLERLSEITDALESGLQQAGAWYTDPVVSRTAADLSEPNAPKEDR